MKKIGLLGAYDKTDLILYIARILADNRKKTLIVDSTTLQKTRYTVPCITPSRCYVTTYEDIDVAVGFDSMKEIKNYYGKDELDYDYILIDIDDNKKINEFELQDAFKNYFVTAFDNYSLKKGMEIIGKTGEKKKMTKVLFSREMKQEEDDYLNFLSFYYDVEWDKDVIYFPYEIGDGTVIMENQRNSRISFKELSVEYRSGLLAITSQIAPEIKKSEIKRILKNV